MVGLGVSRKEAVEWTEGKVLFVVILGIGLAAASGRLEYFVHIGVVLLAGVLAVAVDRVTCHGREGHDEGHSGGVMASAEGGRLNVGRA